MVNERRITITRHIDDFKISQFDTDEVAKLDRMRVIYGSRVKYSRGKKHDYLGTGPLTSQWMDRLGLQ